MTTALLLIDIQNDYFPGGKMELENSVGAAEKAKRLLNVFREKKMSIFHIQHVSLKPGASFFIPKTLGVEFYSEVAPLFHETVIQKHFPNSFRETELLSSLQKEGVTKLVVAGMMTNMCVDATIRAAHDLGFECLVAFDACAACSQKYGDHVVSAVDVHTAFLAALHRVYGQVLTTEEIIQNLSEQL